MSKKESIKVVSKKDHETGKENCLASAESGSLSLGKGGGRPNVKRFSTIFFPVLLGKI
jgi:hypothetical protein